MRPTHLRTNTIFILEDPDRMKYNSMIKDLLKNNQLVLK